MKLMKKIAPIAAAFLMLGATAAAADLGSWKTTFGGADTAIVLGADAATADNIGAINIATALTVTTTSQTNQPVANAHLIKAAGNELNYNEDFFDVEEILDDRDLPTLLMDGTYKESRGDTTNEEDYTQTLTFVTGTDSLVFDAKEDGDEAAGTYLFLADDDAAPAYTYKLEFDNAIEFDDTTIDDDFKMSKLNFMGREYTITAADDDGAGSVGELTLMAGAVKATQNEYTTEAYTIGNKTYSVEVPIIADNEDPTTVVLKVNGETTDEMETGDTYTLDDDTVIGIVDVMANEGTETSATTANGNDLVTFYLGAEKVVLSDTNPVKIGNDEIQGSEVNFDNGADELSAIEITYSPEDNIFVGMGEDWTDPILGRMKYTFQGIASDTEDIAMTTTSDDGKLVLTNNGGDELSIPFVDDDVDVSPGDKLASELSATITVTANVGGDTQVGNLIVANDGDCTDAADVEECEGIKFLAVSSGGEARIIKVTNIDVANTELDLYDETTGVSLNDKDYTSDINLGFTTVNIDVTATAITFDLINNYASLDALGTSADFVSDLGAEMGLTLDDTDADTTIDEITLNMGDVDGNLLVTTAGAVGTYGLDATFDMVITEDPDLDLTWVTEKENSDYQMALDNLDWGAVFKFDSEDDNDLTVTYPEEELSANVYVSEILTNIPELGTSTSSGNAPTPVEDSDWASAKVKNVIVVGGSGINKAAADLLGLTYPTYGSAEAWQTATGVSGPGIAVVKMLANPYATGKYAMLVAGWDGIDTQKAALALKEGTPALTGMIAKLKTSTATVELMA